MLLNAAISRAAEAVATFYGKDFLPGSVVFNLATLTPAETWFEIREG